MTVKKYGAEELLGFDKFTFDKEEPHIVIDKTICVECKEKPCLVICPAMLYTIIDGEISFDYAGCLECGTCRVMCMQKGITKWTYPRGTFGVTYRYG